MKKEEINQFLKENGPINTDGLKSIAENIEKMAKSVSPRLRIKSIPNMKEELLVDIAQNTNETKKNTEIPLWKSLVIAIISSGIGSIVTYLLMLI